MLEVEGETRTYICLLLSCLLTLNIFVMAVQQCHSCKQEPLNHSRDVSLYLKRLGLFPKAVKEMDAGTQVLVKKSWPHVG